MLARLLEPCPVQDVFATNIGQVEILDSCARFVLYVERSGEREIVAKIVMPIQNIPSAIAFTVAQLGGHWVTKPIIPTFLMPSH